MRDETNQLNRRRFLKQAGATSALVAAPYFVPASVLGGEGAVPPSDRIVMGGIGTGGMGRANINTFMNEPEVQMVAVCDVDRSHRELAASEVNSKYGNQDCATYNDFRELLARSDIDAVIVATPDHWHGLISVAAAEAKKDIYCEKPLANSVGEGRAIVDAVERNQCVLQTGSYERSVDAIRFGCELVRNNRLGKVHTVEINLPFSDQHHDKARSLKTVPPPEPVPDGFDYDFWLGHTAKVPYTELRCHFWWRYILAYGGGEMTDRGAHVIDIAQLALGEDDSGPIEYRASGSPIPGSLYDCYWDFTFENLYQSGVRMVGVNRAPRGVKFIGDEGWLFVPIHFLLMNEKLSAEPASLLKETIGEDEIHLGRTASHRRQLLECIKTREKPFAHEGVGHRTSSICHLNNIAMQLGRPLKWDPVTEQFENDDEATAMLMPTMRSPWTL